MAWVILTIILALGAVICHALNKFKKDCVNWDVGGNIFVVFGIIILISGIISSYSFYECQINDIEDVKKFDALSKIYQKKADVLTTQFVVYLAQAYPQFEKDIYRGIAPENVNTYLARYPDLKSSNTLLALVEQISKLQSDFYQQQVGMEQALKNIRTRLRSPWNFNFLIPRQ